MTKENVCVKITNEKDRLELLKVLVDNGQEIGKLTKSGLETGEDSLGNDQMIYPYIGYVPCENGFSGRSTIYPNRTLVSISELEKILKQNDMTQNEKLKQALYELEELKVKIEVLIKPELVIGRWYNYNHCLLNYQGECNEGIIQSYGSIRGEWTDICNCGKIHNQWKEATHEEQIITIYAIMSGDDIVSTTHKKEHALEQCEILNKVNKTDSYIVVSCNGVIIK